MSLPLNINPGKLGRIEVRDDDEHFLVRIHPKNRDRAKKISGRQTIRMEQGCVSHLLRLNQNVILKIRHSRHT